MIEYLKSSIGQSVIWTTVLVALAVAAYYALLKFRDRTVKDQPESGELLSNFREMQVRGEISESEFRTIKTKLGLDLQQELSGKGDEGSNESA